MVLDTALHDRSQRNGRCGDPSHRILFRQRFPTRLGLTTKSMRARFLTKTDEFDIRRKVSHFSRVAKIFLSVCPMVTQFIARKKLVLRVTPADELLDDLVIELDLAKLSRGFCVHQLEDLIRHICDRLMHFVCRVARLRHNACGAMRPKRQKEAREGSMRLALEPKLLRRKKTAAFLSLHRSVPPRASWCAAPWTLAPSEPSPTSTHHLPILAPTYQLTTHRLTTFSPTSLVPPPPHRPTSLPQSTHPSPPARG